MIVCIAEKPSVAKDIARIIGANKAHDGYMEGNGYQVTWTFGHLCELKEPDDYTPMWKRWSLSALPMIPQRFGIKLINDEGIKRQFGIIERLMQAADSIINCGDAGQEGELIQRWVMQKAQAKCPVKRLWISSMTDEAIRQGFQELKDQSEYQPLYLAGLSRAIGDWILGMNATSLYTLKYGLNRQVLSIGRVQIPTLALIVNRQKEIDNFEPEPYWVLATIYRDTQFTATSGKFTSKEEGEKAFSTIAGKPFNVTAVTKKKGTEAPPHLYDLTSLQVDCNKKFSYSADMTLKLIQSLYEKKFTTYPRVDTQFLTDDIYPKCPQILNGVSQAKINSQQKYLPLIQQLAATGKKLPKSKKVFDISKPGITKGQHWHHTKWEQFIVVKGHGLIQQRKEGTDEVIEFEVSGDKIQSVIMLPGYTHNIINLSDTEDLVTVMYCNEIFNPNHPDTYFASGLKRPRPEVRLLRHHHRHSARCPAALAFAIVRLQSPHQRRKGCHFLNRQERHQACQARR